MNYFIKFLSLFFATLTIISCVGCKQNYKDAYIYFELPELPQTLDPQTASTDTELLIVKNIYEGLLRKNESGAIVCGVAESFKIENLTYTFKLRKNAVWSNGDKITANDFVFGFRRAVSPETDSPFVTRLFSISGAESIYNGKSSPESLGVTAVNDTTLTITLAREDSEFENTLTTSIAMPCNEKFFYSSTGKYGLGAKFIISNGSYQLTKWNKEVFGIRLYKNDTYSGSLNANNSAVFLTCNNDETNLEKLKKNNIDIAFIDSSETDEAEKSGLKTTSYQNICWVLTMNSDLSEDMRKSFAMLIGNNVFCNDLKTGYYVADSIFPLAVNDTPTSSGMTFYDLQTAKQLFSKEVNKLPDKKFPSDIKLFYYDNGIIKSIVTDIVGHWQNNLGAYVNIEAVPDIESLSAEITQPTYSMAIFPIRADSSNIGDYLKKFGVSYNGQDLGQIQTQILKGSHIIPIAFQNTTIAYSQQISKIYTELGNGFIDFSFIIKYE